LDKQHKSKFKYLTINVKMTLR